jgi:hypothetical protein
MARSGNYDFDLDRDGIVRGAIRIVKGISGNLDKPIDNQDILDAAETLNIMVKQWQGEGIGLWLQKELYIFLAYRDGQYSLGPSGDHATLSMIETELSSSSAASDTTLTVDSITGISNGDAIGIELNDNTLDWTTVNGTPTGSVITITTGVTSAANVDNNVYTYTTKSQRPLDILEARLYRDGGTDTPLYIANRQEWADLADKENNGIPSQIYYDPQLDSGILHVWPRPSTVDNYIKATAKMPIQDFDAKANDPDFPPEFHRAVKFNLAVDLSFEYNGVDTNRFYQLKKQADYLKMAIGYHDAAFNSYNLEVSYDD